ncbi:hypothetical protein CLV80_103176 [Yoonia maritima]|uniref:Uncharacterized protein n=1 Tax=Yoonia maritima TaxID=1435347 RepID=A0A2T0W1K3_9RHOB|nr:hypothetical protein [Yoonia maritima]PRY78850.1 hypothetical protein CLV80_103176 [Yoonia maritima]
MTVFTNVMSAVQKRGAYSHLKYELQSMPQETAGTLVYFAKTLQISPPKPFTDKV